MHDTPLRPQNEKSPYPLAFAFIIALIAHIIILAKLNTPQTTSTHNTPSIQPLSIELNPWHPEAPQTSTQSVEPTPPKVQTLTPAPVKIPKAPTTPKQQPPKISAPTKTTPPPIPPTIKPQKQLNATNLINNATDYLNRNHPPKISKHKRLTHGKDPRIQYYLDTWQQKIESVGRLNFPKEATENKLYGKLRLAIIIHKSGQVENVALQQSSGHPLLDEAAIKIINLAAPFAPIPQEILQGSQSVEIIQSWSFTANKGFFSTKK